MVYLDAPPLEMGAVQQHAQLGSFDAPFRVGGLLPWRTLEEELVFELIVYVTPYFRQGVYPVGKLKGTFADKAVQHRDVLSGKF